MKNESSSPVSNTVNSEAGVNSTRRILTTCSINNNYNKFFIIVPVQHITCIMYNVCMRESRKTQSILHLLLNFPSLIYFQLGMFFEKIFYVNP